MAAFTLKLSRFFKPMDPNVKPPKGQHRCVADPGCVFVGSYRPVTLRRHLLDMHGENPRVVEYFRLFQAQSSAMEERSRKRGAKAQGTLDGCVSSLSKDYVEKLNHAAARYITLGGVPFNALTNAWLRELLRLAVPPSPRTLVEKYAPIISQDVHDVVKAKLESASFLTLTSDGWKRNRMFLNSVVVCTPDPVLIGVYRAEEREDGAYLR